MRFGDVEFCATHTEQRPPALLITEEALDNKVLQSFASWRVPTTLAWASEQDSSIFQALLLITQPD